MPSRQSVINAARTRRVRAALNRDIKIQWFIREVSNKIELTMRRRVRVATELVTSRIIQNISRPVTVSTGPRGGRVVTNRSKPGEFPKSDKGDLLKSIFNVVVTPRRGMVEGRIGSEVIHGGILERSAKLDRNYAARTLNETRALVLQILTGPIK
jgi:hypothetical protein